MTHLSGNRFGLSSLVLLAALGSLNACTFGKRPVPAAGGSVQNKPAGNVQLQQPGSDMSKEKALATATFRKAELLNRELLYGVDIQNSSLKSGNDFMPALSLGHFKARYLLTSRSLQLVAVSNHLVESRANHPEQLIHEWPIVQSDADTVSVSIDSASPILAALIGGSGAPRTNWLRSAEYIASDQLLLLQTSIETANGEVVEFIESVMPRERLVKPSLLRTQSFSSPLYDSEELEPLSQRFGFLSSTKVFFDDSQGQRKSASAAQRFGWSPETSDSIITWYVTPNLPDELLPTIKAAVEGWNRYSQKLWSIDMIRFAGKLPSGIALGDPRYNVIYWDTVDEAGAAYESQSSDPETGIQSHSLIYLPQAWIRLGKQAHKNSFPGDSFDLKKARRSRHESPRLLGQAIHSRCLKLLSDRPLVSEESLDGISPETFGRELLKQTLMHEVGHALGMDHNFKGSLAFDPESADSLPTHSVMDYNNFFAERAIFESVDSANGPLLEYDRQIISALYKKGADLSEKDPILPTCNDEDADRILADGVTAADLLCNRYDLGQDPTVVLEKTWALLGDDRAKVGPISSLGSALARLEFKIIGKAEEWLTTRSDHLKAREDVSKAISVLAERLGALEEQYLISGHDSVFGSLRANKKTLLSASQSPQEEKAFRSRFASVALQASQLRDLPAPSKAARQKVLETLQRFAERTPWALSQPQPSEAAATLISELASNETTLAKLRAAAVKVLQLPKGATAYASDTTSEFGDFEALAVKASVSLVVNSLESFSVRKAAAATLASYAKTEAGRQSLQLALNQVNAELSASKTARSREELRTLLSLLVSR